MQCARFINSKNCKIRLDLAENLFPEKESLAENLLMRRNKFAEWPAESLLNGIVMPKLSFAVLKQAGISLRGRTISDLAEQEILHIADMIHSYTLQVTGTRGFEEAQVTAGGADCSEFDPSNMESRIVKGLFASGEVLNIDGDCGGFNLMFAFISGILAGKNKRAWERDS
jgi:predicted flavoprotein YhiN